MLVGFGKRISGFVLLFSILPVVYLKKNHGGDSMFKKSVTGGPVHGKDGEKIIYCPAGPPGPSGAPGAQGVPGRDGRDGRDLPVLNGARPACPPPPPCPVPVPCPTHPASVNIAPERDSAGPERHHAKTKRIE